jgi:3D (Asp-Asp-Asp) domain-containing protein
VFRRLALVVSIALLAGCAERPLPTWEPPLARTQYQHVRTTAYFDGEADHRAYTNHNALGTTLRTGPINSAAADWGRWPAGTMFRILQTGQTYIVDDYGWALAGRNTIDLYEPTREQMDRWGVRHVDIQILQWGDPRESYATLEPRSGYRHVARMLHELRPQCDGPIVTEPCAPPPMVAQPMVAQPVVAQPVAPQPYMAQKKGETEASPFLEKFEN